MDRSKKIQTDGYSFKTEDAVRYGQEEAVLMQGFQMLLDWHRSHDKDFHDGRYWCRDTVEALVMRYPFWSTTVIRRLLVSLKTQGVLLHRQDLNHKDYDRTGWYSLIDSPIVETNDTIVGIDKTIAQINKTIPILPHSIRLEENSNSATNTKPEEKSPAQRMSDIIARWIAEKGKSDPADCRNLAQAFLEAGISRDEIDPNEIARKRCPSPKQKKLGMPASVAETIRDAIGVIYGNETIATAPPIGQKKNDDFDIMHDPRFEEMED